MNPSDRPDLRNPVLPELPDGYRWWIHVYDVRYAGLYTGETGIRLSIHTQEEVGNNTLRKLFKRSTKYRWVPHVYDTVAINKSGLNEYRDTTFQTIVEDLSEDVYEKFRIKNDSAFVGFLLEVEKNTVMDYIRGGAQ